MPHKHTHIQSQGGVNVAMDGTLSVGKTYLVEYTVDARFLVSISLEE